MPASPSAYPPRSDGPFAVLARLIPTDELPAVGLGGGAGSHDGPDDGLGGYRLVVWKLVRDLGRAYGVGYAALWVPAGDDDGGPGWHPVVAWQRGPREEGPALPDRADDPDELLATAGVAATVDVRDGGARHGMLVLADRERPEPWPEPATLLGETAVCVGLLLRLTRHRAAATAARIRADRAARQADVVRLELSAVQAVERDRLATAVTATPDRQLRQILARADALGEALTAEAPEAEAIAATIRAGLHEMIEGFRTVVRGVYPQVLRGSGVAAALEEIAAALAVPVVFHGELGRRQGWEIESTLYQAAASAVVALNASGGDEPISVELSRDGDVLVIRASRARVDPVGVAAVLRDDSRRLAALGGRLTIDRASDEAAADRASDEAAAVVDIRLPERFGRGRPEPARPPASQPAGAAAPAGPSGDATANDATPAACVRHLLAQLAERGAACARSVPVRVALARQDRRARVLVLGAQAEQLLRMLCDLPEGDDRVAPGPSCAVPTWYEHGPYRRITLEPAGGGRGVRLPDASGVAWPQAVAGLDRLLVEVPSDALRGLRLLHRRDRVDADLAMRLRRWSEEPYGLPDAVLLALGGPASTAESELLTVLRAPDRGDFSPVVVCAMRQGAAGSPGSRQWLATMSDAVVDWQPTPEGVRAVDEALRLRLPASSGALAARWALRALLARRAVGGWEDEFAHAVEAAVAGAYEVAELDLLQALQGRVRLPRGHDDALRLLGAHGPDPRSRLGLPGDADAEQVRRAAGRALAVWRAQSLSPESRPQVRGTCALLVRACERLLTDGDG
ncbi:hypothetical protein [Micromonospora sp. DT233]|uniref:hypothetical protein n=1 Tax=Micromonospora sp. DT233 TaxID=3393432 RepID=UPI003CE74EA2